MNSELIEKLNSFLEKINEILALNKLGLLKSDEMYGTKYSIEDELTSIKDKFGKIGSLKIEKAISKWRNEPKRGIFINIGEANKELEGLYQLLLDLNSEIGSESIKPVSMPEIQIDSDAINRAIEDAKILLQNDGGAVSAVDRIHTVLHGYLKNICDDEKILYGKDATLNELMKNIKIKHPAFKDKNEYIDQILKSLVNIFDKLNPIRNSSSLAHANEALLEIEEAAFVIDSANSILRYLSSKLKKGIKK